MSKYDIPDDHEWQDEQERREERMSWADETSLDSFEVSVVHHYGDEWYEKKKYECSISIRDDGTKVVYNVIPHKFKGNYYREAEFNDWMDFNDVPDPVKQRVAATVGRSVAQLTPEVRTHE